MAAILFVYTELSRKKSNFKVSVKIFFEIVLTIVYSSRKSSSGDQPLGTCKHTFTDIRVYETCVCFPGHFMDVKTMSWAVCSMKLIFDFLSFFHFRLFLSNGKFHYNLSKTQMTSSVCIQ